MNSEGLVGFLWHISSMVGVAVGVTGVSFKDSLPFGSFGAGVEVVSISTLSCVGGSWALSSLGSRVSGMCNSVGWLDEGNPGDDLVWLPLQAADCAASKPIWVVGDSHLDIFGLQKMYSLLSVSTKILRFLSKVNNDSLLPKSNISSGLITIKGSVFVALSTISRQEISVLVCLDILLESSWFSTFLPICDIASSSLSLSVRSSIMVLTGVE